MPEFHTVVLSAEPESGSYGSERHKTRLLKRKTAADALFSVREELFSGEFEGWGLHCRVGAVALLISYNPGYSSQACTTLFRFLGNYFRTWGALHLWLSIALTYRFVCRAFYRGWLT